MWDVGYGMREKKCASSKMRELIISLRWFGSVDHLDYIDYLESENKVWGVGS